MVSHTKKPRTQSPVNVMTNSINMLATTSSTTPTKYGNEAHSLPIRRKRRAAGSLPSTVAETEGENLLTNSSSNASTNSALGPDINLFTSPYVRVTKLQIPSPAPTLTSEIERLKLAVEELKTEMRDIRCRKDMNAGFSENLANLSELSTQVGDIKSQVCELAPLNILTKTINPGELDTESVSKIDTLINFITTEVIKRLDTKLSVIVYNIPDNEGLKKVQSILLRAAKMPNSQTKCHRLKKSQHDHCCPIRLQFETQTEAKKFTNTQRILLQDTSYKQVKVVADKTVIERRAYNHLNKPNGRTPQATKIDIHTTNTVELIASPLSNPVKIAPEKMKPNERLVSYSLTPKVTSPPSTVDLDMSMDSHKMVINPSCKLTTSSLNQNVTTQMELGNKTGRNTPLVAKIPQHIQTPKNISRFKVNNIQNHASNQTKNKNKDIEPKDNNDTTYLHTVPSHTGSWCSDAITQLELRRYIFVLILSNRIQTIYTQFLPETVKFSHSTHKNTCEILFFLGSII
ncbi:unnamed protein product [Trichobilharzia szidati]|nr:unnamed protein product [Trichobilharzia szidati]